MPKARRLDVTNAGPGAIVRLLLPRASLDGGEDQHRRDHRVIGVAERVWMLSQLPFAA